MEKYEKELRLADVIAAKMGRRWKAVEVDDLASHLYLWLLENQRALQRWRLEVGGEGKLYNSLRREAAKYCSAETSARVNRPIDDSPAYPVEVLERALPFIYEGTPETLIRINPATGEPLEAFSESGRAQALLADIRGAYYGLPREIQEVLAWRFRDGLTYEEIGELSGMTKDGAKKRVTRAVRRLSDALGSEG